MKYLIVTLIKEDAEKYQQKLLYSVANRFNVNGAIQRKPPAHITLKYSFETDNINPVEKAIEEFSKSINKSKYQLTGINHFDEDVIFIDVIPSKEMSETYSNFINHLRKNTKITFKQFDGNTHFHSSIAHTDIKTKFQEIWNFVSKENPDFEVFFDNITILKLIDGIWQIHKEYYFI